MGTGTLAPFDDAVFQYRCCRQRWGIFIGHAEVDLRDLTERLSLTLTKPKLQRHLVTLVMPPKLLCSWLEVGEHEMPFWHEEFPEAKPGARMGFKQDTE